VCCRSPFLLCNLSAASYRFPPYYSLHRHHPSILIDSSHPRIMAGRWVSHRSCPCAVPVPVPRRYVLHQILSGVKSPLIVCSAALYIIVATEKPIAACLNVSRNRCHTSTIHPLPHSGRLLPANYCLLLLEHIAKPPRHQDVVCAFEFGCQHPPLSIKKHNSPSLLLNPRNKPTILPTPHNRINKPHHDGTSHHPRN
jgi:hypothetical protein